MAEPEEPETQRNFPPKSKEMILNSSQTQTTHTVVGVERENLMMDLDLDLDSSWTFDQIFSAATNSGNPFLVPASEQPCSPLWAFSDENNEDNKPSGNSTAVGLRLSDYPRLLSCKLVLEAFDSHIFLGLVAEK